MPARSPASRSSGWSMSRPPPPSPTAWTRKRTRPSRSTILVAGPFTSPSSRWGEEAAEKAKIELSTAQESEINLPFITADASGPKHLNLKLTRSKLEQLVEEI